MTTAELKKEVDIFNQSFGKSHFFKHLKETTKNRHFSLGITTFNTPPIDRGKDKKLLKTQKDLRRELQTFFKEKKEKIPLNNTLSIISIPEQLSKIITLTCRPPGFNHKINTGGELYSIVNVYKDNNPNQIPELTEIQQLLNLIGEPNSLFLSTTHMTFTDYKLKQVTPIDFTEAPPNTQHTFLSLKDLKELEVIYKNYKTLDKHSKEELGTGLNYLERIRTETDAYIALPLLTAGIEFFIQGSEKDPQLYFNTMCKDLAAKTGFTPTDKNLFDNFYTTRENLLRERKKTGLDRTGKKDRLLLEMEQFYRLLLKKMAYDPVFLKQTLPGLKTSRKKEIKKIAVKKRWRKFPGRHLERLFDAH